MAATDQHYRSQKTLDVVFGVSCLLMLVSTIWMFVQDYNREFKKVQREFRDVEAALNERAMLVRLPSEAAVDARLESVEKARKELADARAQLAPTARAIQARRDKQDAKARSLKADFDAKSSYLVQTRDALSMAQGPEKDRLEKKKADQEKELAQLEKDLTKAQTELEGIDAEYKAKVRDELAPKEDALSRAEDDLKRLTGEFDRYAKATAQKTWKFGDTFRNWPILDAFASPTKISQIVLPELTIDYNFKDVPRYDRCTTCHLGIDRGMFDREALSKLSSAPDDLRKKLDTAHKILQEREKSGENLGYDVSDLPKDVRTKKLTQGQVTMYAAHPRLDLFVEANSPHPMHQFGCTICHSGQGSATEFVLASHAPADYHQEHDWEKRYDWKAIHYWDYPMYSKRFTESSCLKCHHQVTDLVRYGSKQEAPKVTRGFDLVRENGCFGCHEIAGSKAGRSIGPDLRLETVPPLDWMTPSEREKAQADKLNPPGTYRKVGPSLRRIAEKTNQEWARKWIASPRGFREDTKMPHFYGLSNNSAESKDKNEALPDEQKDFPPAEIHSIAYYLFAESKGNLHYTKDPKDDGFTTRRVQRLTQARLQKALKGLGLTDKEKKDLDEVTRTLTDLALLAVPAKHAEINAASDEVRRLQDRWFEAGKLEVRKKRLDALTKPNESEQAELESVSRSLADLKADLGDRLDEATKKFSDLATPIPISSKILTVDGAEVSAKSLETKASNDSRAKGRKLFTQKGCLACHSHDGTEGEGKMSVAGEANFGPNLSRVAAKIKPELGNDGRRWLFQWILNPNIHHPRTRMPVTRLTEEEALAVADWLLSQETDWKQEDPKTPERDTLRRLARVYLAKAPGMTRADVDKVLPESGDDIGFDADRLAFFPPDAEEHRLRKTESKRVTNEDLMWYIGRKSIGRLGCYGCHDLPGFEQSKPIGAALNDWGKKDPERLAFEDGDSFVRAKYHLVPSRETKKDLEKRVAKLDREGRVEELKAKLKKDPDNFTDQDRWELRDLTVPNPKNPDEDSAREIREPLTEVEKDELKELKERLEHDAPWGFEEGKPPYEQHSFDALEHHKREGFLHLKLSDPRSYDYNRTRAWDDRLRMPQFRFARTRRHKGEEDKDYKDRLTQEEAEAREAVMTFILGLTAENISPKYIYRPNPDRHAEVKGRQVLEKFNCVGCHQLRSSVFEFKLTDDMKSRLHDKAVKSASSYKDKYAFLAHNAWVGFAPTAADRLAAVGNFNPAYDPTKSADQMPVRHGHPVDKDGRYDVRLNEALRFNDANNITHDLPAAETIGIALPDILWRSDQYGGKFVELLVPYLLSSGDQTIKLPDNARDALPPPLHREGERVQPGWLYNFLLNPKTVRPHVILNMPRFNMSPEEATALVDYFGAVERLTNPAAGSGAPQLTIPQRDARYWTDRTPGYAAAVEKKGQLDARLKALRPQLRLVLEEDAENASRRREIADEKLKKSPDVQELKDQLEAAKKAEEEAKRLVKDKVYGGLEKEYKERDAYAADAYRLLVSVGGSGGPGACLGCHQIQGVGARKAPPLDLAAERLRPEWTRKWVANPQAMFAYNPAMPVNVEKKPAGQEAFQDLFVGSSLEQVDAIRDALMDLSRISTLPANRYYHMPPAGGKP